MEITTQAAVCSTRGRDFSQEPHTLFLSDVHLDGSRPDVTRQLVEFLSNLPASTERLYIVGDLFEAWIGDDAPGSVGEQTILLLRTLSDRGIRGYFTHGNRDFLIGNAFAQLTGFEILPDELVIDCYGTPVLLLHGDTLCTDDTDYQSLRATLRNPDFQANLMAMSVPQRLELAQQLRSASASEMSNKSDDIMDANNQAIAQALERHGVNHMLHGHTHRPGVHSFELNGKPCTRLVLGDWFEQGSIAYWSEQGPELQSLLRAPA